MKVDSAQVCSYLGKSIRHRGRQPLSLDRGGCWNDKTIVHEFIHAWGFDHEQNRPDRDNYVEIKYNNIQSRPRSNFNKQRGGLTFGIPYDGLSVMHYEAYNSFAINRRRPTIESKYYQIRQEKKQPKDLCQTL